jgi:hypothetical protein
MDNPRQKYQVDPSQIPILNAPVPSAVPSLEQKEIRGVTFKLAWMILGSTATIVIFLITSYNKLKDSIRDTQITTQIMQVEITSLRTQLNEQRELNKRQDDKIENLENKVFQYEAVYKP